MAPLTAIARATSVIMLCATSLFGQRTTSPIVRPPTLGATLQLPLAAPTNLTVTPAATSASLRWDAVSGATGYLVERTSAMYGNIIQTPTPIASTSFTDVSQQFDPRYLHTYRVMAVYPDGRYGASTVTYLPPPPRVSYPAYGGSCYGGWAGWTMQWTGVPEATGYVVSYKMSRKNDLNAWYSVDTTIVVGASPTSHFVDAYCTGRVAWVFQTTGVDNAAVASLFAGGARSAPTPATASK